MGSGGHTNACVTQSKDDANGRRKGRRLCRTTGRYNSA